jgi:hypothetical protein
MKRKELFEFEDFSWVPSSIRTGATNLIVVFHKKMGTADVVSQLLINLKRTTNFNQIVDLGSGSGGAMFDVIQNLNEQNKTENQVQLILSDLHPNKALVDSINNKNIPNVSYNPKSVNATNLKDSPEGIKTMIASFHHMNPTVAKQILTSAEENEETILIFEVAQNNIPFIVWLCLLPISLPILVIMSLFMTPFVKQLKFSQILFTYIIPLIPILYAWDGQASLMRTYTFKDIETLIGDQSNKNYEWKMGEGINSKGKKFGYYLQGTKNKQDA